MDATGTNILTYAYDANSRLTNRWSIQKGNITNGYDAVGNLTSVTYPSNHALAFTYDAMNRLIQMSDDIGTTMFTYTPTGQLKSETGPWASDTVWYAYTNRMRTGLDLQQPNGADWVQSYGYDLAGRMTGVASAAGTFSYIYNPGLAGTTSSSSLTSKIALPNGAFITNTLDGNARMLGTWLKNSANGVLDYSGYSYNQGNQRTNIVRGATNSAGATNASYANYTYDPIGQVTSDLAYEPGGSTPRLNEQLTFGFDPAGNLAYRTNNALIANFQVNSLNELTANTNGGTLTVVGTTTSLNISVTVNGSNALSYKDATFAATNMPLTTTYTAVASDGYGRTASNTANVNLATNVTFQYDLNGNLTNDGLRSFAYDDENQLVQVWATNQWLSQFSYRREDAAQNPQRVYLARQFLVANQRGLLCLRQQSCHPRAGRQQPSHDDLHARQGFKRWSGRRWGNWRPARQNSTVLCRCPNGKPRLLPRRRERQYNDARQFVARHSCKIPL